MDSTTLSHGIQLAVAPVFMLTAVAALIGVLAQRLARIIDRARTLELWRLETIDLLAPPGTAQSLMVKGALNIMAPVERLQRLLTGIENELSTLRERGRIVNWSIGLLTLSAMLVVITIVALFVEEISPLNSARFVPGFFLAGLACFAAALGCFLWEVMLATQVLRFGHTSVYPPHAMRQSEFERGD